MMIKVVSVTVLFNAFILITDCVYVIGPRSADLEMDLVG